MQRGSSGSGHLNKRDPVRVQAVSCTPNLREY
jgi:hypothetical protein